MKPQMIIEDWSGLHNKSSKRIKELDDVRTYQDLSTICIVPTRGMIPAKVVQNWMCIMPLMNQKFVRVFMIGMEVGDAYSAAIEQIITNPDLKNWKYILTLEEDNMPPPDGLLNLYKGMEEYDVVGGLYWTKGEAGQPMIYGDPKVMPRNFIPQKPIPDTLQPCNGLGMGFTLFKLDMFKDKKLRRPWFKTHQDYQYGVGASSYTQDLYFFEDAAQHGYKFACDTRIRVGHYDVNTDIVW